MSLKALSINRLQVNSQVNRQETSSFPGCKPNGKLIDPDTMLKEMLDDLNRHQWPEGLTGMPNSSEIDKAYLAGDIESLQSAIQDYKATALRRLSDISLF